MKSTKTNKMVHDVLNSMTRTELRNLAVQLAVPRGRNKGDTEKNLEQAFCENKAHIKSMVYINAAPIPPSTHGQTLLIKKFVP
jgi:hypothetical protein